MKLKSKYNYPVLEREDSPSGRRYIVGDQRLPSVTTILSQTKSEEDMEVLRKWKDRVGEVAAKEILDKSLLMGTALHQNMEDYVRIGQMPRNGNAQVKMMSTLMINQGLQYLDEAWGCEIPLYNPGLYAGTADLIGVYRGRSSIIDFKNSRKMKKKEWIQDYAIQCAAYKMAHDSVYDTSIEQFVILMVDHGFEFKEFIFSMDEVLDYCEMWAKKVEIYYNNQAVDIR